MFFLFEPEKLVVTHTTRWQHIRSENTHRSGGNVTADQLVYTRGNANVIEYCLLKTIDAPLKISIKMYEFL